LVNPKNEFFSTAAPSAMGDLPRAWFGRSRDLGNYRAEKDTRGNRAYASKFSSKIPT
jgi:hypothetical protein